MNFKVACIGNMNNNMFSLVRYLRDFNIDATLFLLNNETEHFSPLSDTFDSNYDYIKKLTWGSNARKLFLPSTPGKVREDFKQYDVLIGCGVAPAFLERAGLKLHIFMPYGADLYSVPFLPARPITRRMPAKLILAYYQKRGIRHSLLTTAPVVVKCWSKAIETLGIKHYPILYPMVYCPQYNNLNFEKSSLQYSQSFLQIRSNYDVVVFNHSRQIWKTFIDDVSLKGNDVLIRGFADYVKRGTKKAVLVLFEYGIDVIESKKLISQLGVADSVIWMPKMFRKEIMFGLSLADFGSDQFIVGDGGGGTCWEVMATGKPVFAYFGINQEEFSALNMGKPFPPIVNVKTPDEIVNHLINFEKQPDYYKKLGEKAKNWYSYYMGKGLAEKYLYLVKTIAAGKEIVPKKLRFD
ncbi:MAG TPA: hypothetical protein ENH85_14150 [Candidatus Scalindua sp.]|nr:hypothetical protein [Candidatus Scalindua sp.]